MLQLATIISQSSVCPTASVMEDLPSMSVTVKFSFCFCCDATRPVAKTGERERANNERTPCQRREREREKLEKRGEKKEREK